MKPYPAKYTYIDYYYGERVVNCEIWGWCDKSDRFAIKYYDRSGVYQHHWTPFHNVSGWAWPNLSKHFETHGWD